jgi:hypothetical protein
MESRAKSVELNFASEAGFESDEGMPHMKVTVGCVQFSIPLLMLFELQRISR